MIDNLFIFDCDGVLVDSEVIACRIEAEELTKIGYPITLEEDIKRFAGVSQKSLCAIVEKEMGKPLPESFVNDFEKKVIEALSTELKSINGIEEVLEIVPKKAIASSGIPEKIENSLRVTKLEDFFEAKNIFSTVMVDNGKPAPDLFLHTADRLGFKPQNCIVIEDSIAGVQAGKNAGMTVFGFIGGAHILDKEGYEETLKENGADHVFGTMEDVANFIKSYQN